MRILLSLSFILNLIAGIGAQGIEFFEGDWTEALEIAKKEDKLLFVDAYAEWCGPCKVMARTVFVDMNVGAYFNENFINMQIDMEKGQGLDFQKKYPVSAFPTLYFINGEGEVVLREIGGKNTDAFIQIGKLAIRQYDRSDEFAKEYEKGNRDYELVYNYVKALNKAEKSSLKISNEYLSAKPKITREQESLFILEACIESDSRIFEMLTDRIGELKTSVPESVIYDKIESACESTVQKAIQFESYFLVEDAKSKMKSYYKDRAEHFDIWADMEYFNGIGDIPEYLKYLEKYADKKIANEDVQLHAYAEILLNKHGKRSDALDLAEKLCEKALKVVEEIPYLITLAKVLTRNGKNEKALRKAYLAREKTQLNGDPTIQIDGLIRYIESQLN